MSDPVLDEELILALLRTPVSVANIGNLQAGAVQALIDMYDRKTTREAFMHHAATAVSLYGQTCKLALLASVKENFDHGDLDIARFMQAEGALLKLIQTQAATVAGLIEQLRQCSTSQDQVH